MIVVDFGRIAADRAASGGSPLTARCENVALQCQNQKVNIGVAGVKERVRNLALTDN